MSTEALNLRGPICCDDRITSIQDHAYNPYTTSFNHNDEIRIVIQNQDLYVLPHKSYIYIEGRINCTPPPVAEGARAPETPCFVNNAAGFLFNEIRYELNGFPIDICKNVGITSTLKGYISFSPNDMSRMRISSWNIKSDQKATAGYVNFCIPLKSIFGFAEDYRNIIMNAKHELILVRSNSDVNVFVGPSDHSTITIDKIQWRIPHVTVSDSEKLKLMQIINKKQQLQLNYRTWELYEYPVLPTTNKHIWSVKASSQLNTPRFIIVAFQTGRNNTIVADKSRFDHCDLLDLKVYLNSESFPYENLNVNFGNYQYAILYEMYARFQEEFYHDRSPYYGAPMLTFEEFRTIAPIIVVDCSHQNETLKKSIIDIRIEFQTRTNIAANTTAYCLIVHDNIVTYNPYTNIVSRSM